MVTHTYIHTYIHTHTTITITLTAHAHRGLIIHCQPMVNGEAFLDEVIIHIMFCSKGQNDFASSYSYTGLFCS